MRVVLEIEVDEDAPWQPWEFAHLLKRLVLSARGTEIIRLHVIKSDTR